MWLSRNPSIPTIRKWKSSTRRSTPWAATPAARRMAASLSRMRTTFEKADPLGSALLIRPCISSGWPCRPGCAAPADSGPEGHGPGGRAGDRIGEAADTDLLVSSKEQKILGLSNHRTGDYSFPINAANTSSNFHLILICSASYTRTCSTKIRSSSLVSVFASLY